MTGEAMDRPDDLTLRKRQFLYLQLETTREGAGPPPSNARLDLFWTARLAAGRPPVRKGDAIRMREHEAELGRMATAEAQAI